MGGKRRLQMVQCTYSAWVDDKCMAVMCGRKSTDLISVQMSVKLIISDG